MQSFASVRPLVLLLLLLASSADAATYVVAKSGRDANPGTAARPFLTITRALRQLRPGDAVLVRTGVYREAVKLWDLKGTRDAPIRLAAHPGDQPVIDGTGTNAKPGLLAIGSSEWIHVEGFEIRNSPNDGISLREVRQIVLRGNHVHHSRLGGIRAWNGNSDLRILGNNVHHNVLSNASGKTKQWSQAIGVEDSDRVLIQDNRVYKNYGEGIDYIRSNRGQIVRNRVSDNFSINVYLDNARYTTIDSNLIWMTDDKAFWRGGEPSTAIGLANERYRKKNPLSDLTIINNIAIRGRVGVYYADSERRGGLHNTRIAHNTFYGFTWATFVLGSESRSRSAGHTSLVLENNIAYQRRGTAYTDRPSTGITFRNNAWFGGDSRTRFSGPGDVNADPRFVKTGGSNAADYRLAANSPCRDKGRTSTTIKRDHFGTARPRGRASDIGAHEH